MRYTVNKDYNKIAKFEKAIAKKYGKETIQNPKSKWTEAKEKKYLKSVKRFYEKRNRIVESKKINTLENRPVEGFKGCDVCSKFFLTPKDEICMKKYDCCFNCYLDFVEGRETRWQSGWRPDKESIFKKS